MPRRRPTRRCERAGSQAKQAEYSGRLECRRSTKAKIRQPRQSRLGRTLAQVGAAGRSSTARPNSPQREPSRPQEWCGDHQAAEARSERVRLAGEGRRRGADGRSMAAARASNTGCVRTMISTSARRCPEATRPAGANVNILTVPTPRRDGGRLVGTGLAILDSVKRVSGGGGEPPPRRRTVSGRSRPQLT